MSDGLPNAILRALSEAARSKHARFATLLVDAEPVGVKSCPDGSLWFEITHPAHAGPLTDAEIWALCGTHPGLPFTVSVQGEAELYLGLVSFVRRFGLPKIVEVNSLSSAASGLLAGWPFTLELEPPGNDPTGLAGRHANDV